MTDEAKCDCDEPNPSGDFDVSHLCATCGGHIEGEGTELGGFLDSEYQPRVGDWVAFLSGGSVRYGKVEYVVAGVIQTAECRVEAADVLEYRRG